MSAVFDKPSNDCPSQKTHKQKSSFTSNLNIVPQPCGL